MNDRERALIDRHSDDSGQGRLNRRDFIQRAATIGGGAALAAGSLSALSLAQAGVAAAGWAPTNLAEAPADPFAATADEPSIVAEMVEFASLDPSAGNLRGYLARPTAEGLHPAVVIVHENRGLVEHTRDVARRYAREGFVALAPDLLSREGGTESVADPGQIPSLLSQAEPDRHAADVISAGAFVRQLPYVQSAIYGVTGFCFGGAVTWRVATQDPAVAAAIPFYGSNPPLEAVPSIRGKVMGIYAELDARVTGGLPDLLRALREANVRHEIHVFYDTNHAFFNDTGQRFAPAAAADAWAKSVSWMRMHLPTP